MKKRFAVVALILMLVLVVTGCARPQQAEIPAENVVSAEKLKEEAGLDGMAKKLYDQESIASSGVITDAEVIGAQKGYRFTDSANSDVTIEVYEFNLEKLSETGKATVDSVNDKEKGYFTIFGQEVPAQMSKNGKYMLVYTDPKLQGDNTDEARQERKDAVLKVFNSWK